MLRHGFAVTAVAAQIASAQPAGTAFPQEFDFDAAHSSMGFSVGFMGLSTVRGAFATFAGTIMYVPNEPERSSVSAIILTKSISTNNATRDTHLKSPDFFDVVKYPYIVFKSVAVQKNAKGLAVEGDFSMHGVTRRITVPFTMLNAPVADAWGNQRMTFAGQLSVSRKEYGILGTAFWNSEFDPGRMAVSDKVDIELLVSATVSNVERWTDPVGDSLALAVQRQGITETVRQFRGLAAARPAYIDSLSEFSFVDAAEKLGTRKRAEDAVALYSFARELRPRSGQLVLWQARACVRAGDLVRAKTLFERAQQMDSLSTATWEWLRVLRK